MNIFTALLDICMPPREEARLLRSLSPSDILKFYNPGSFEGTLYLTPYTQPAIRAAITEHKFYANPQATVLLQALLQTWIMTQPADTLYMPIPLSKNRVRKRGYNHVATLLQSVVPEARLLTTVLHRQRDTPPQTALPRRERLKNVQNAFACDQTRLTTLSGSTIVLIDDVVTTGATLAAARAALTRQLPPATTLRCVAVAH